MTDFAEFVPFLLKCGVPRRYLSSTADEALGDGLYIVGNVGTGKTYTASGIAIHAITEGRLKTLAFMGTTAFYNGIRASFNGNGTSPLERCKAADLLVLDDVDKAVPSRWTMQVLYELVDYRYGAMLPTVYTANSGIGDLGARMASLTGDNETAQAIVSRIHETCRVVTMEGNDKRLEKPITGRR